MQSKHYPDTYKEIKKIDSTETDFLAGYFINKCVGIYDTDYYPLLVTHKKDEELEIWDTTNSHYILEKKNNKIVAIYNSSARKIFEINKNQKIKLLSNDLEKFGTPFRYSGYENNLYINLYTSGNSILFDVTNSRIILRSYLPDSEFYITGDFILEAQENKIKAIYRNNYSPELIIRTNNNNFKILSFLHDYFIMENDSYNKCRSIYSSCIERPLITSDTYDLKLALSYYSSVLGEYEPETMLITGEVENKCKAIYFLDSQHKKIIRHKTLKDDDERYFEVDKTGIIKVMKDGKCIKLLNHNFKSLLSVRYKKNSSVNLHFEIHSEYIAKMYKDKCIAIYDLKTQELLANTTNLNIDIKTCKSKYTDLYFLYMLNDKCIEIKGNARNISLPDTTYEIHFSSIDNSLDYVYGIINGRKTGVFDFNLKCIDWLKSSSKQSFEVVDTFMYTDVKKDIYNTEYKQLCQRMLYFKKNSNGKALEIFDEKKHSIFKVFDDDCLELFGRNMILSKYKGICIINNAKVMKTYDVSCNESFIPFTSKSGNLFIIKYNSISKLGSLYSFQNNDITKIIGNYSTLLDCNEFFLALKNNSQTVEIAPILSLYLRSHSNLRFDSRYGGTLILEVDDPKGFIYAMENVNNKNIAVYSISMDNGFDEILHCDSGIEPTYVSNDIFFETSKGIFNKVGNKL